jgi:hypothetical protein
VFYGLGGAIGNLLIALILKNDDINQEILNENITKLFDYTVCGSNFCPTTELPPSSNAKNERVF